MTVVVAKNKKLSRNLSTRL